MFEYETYQKVINIQQFKSEYALKFQYVRTLYPAVSSPSVCIYHFDISVTMNSIFNSFPVHLITFGRPEIHTLYEKFTHGLEISPSPLEYQNDCERLLVNFKFPKFFVQNRQLKVTPCGYVMFYVYLDGIRKTFIANLTT